MIIHTYPLNDLKEHILEGDKCWCKPEDEEYFGNILRIHNSADGREDYETGKRKYN